MLMQFGKRPKKWYLCIAKRREPVHTGFLLFLCLKIRLFCLGDRKIYLRDKKFFGLGTIFFGLGRSAQRRFRKFFGLQIIKDIKVFRAHKLDFNISGDCSGGHCKAMYRTLLATCGSENFRGLYSIKLRIFGFHFSRSHTLQATCGTLPFNENLPE